MISQRQLFLKHIAQTSKFPLGLEIEKAKGVWMFGKENEKFTYNFRHQRIIPSKTLFLKEKLVDDGMDVTRYFCQNVVLC